jgi:hypothetical protein
MAEGHRFAGVNWEDAIDQLTVEAIRIFATAGLVGADRVLKGLGLSPADLVYQTVEKVLEDVSVQYRKSRGPLLPFLKHVMRNDFIDALRNKSYKTTIIIDPVDAAQQNADGEALTLDGFAGPAPPPADVLWRQRVRHLAADDPALIDYVDVILEIGLTKPSDIAEFLSTSVADILNRRRRLASRVARIPELLKR